MAVTGCRTAFTKASLITSHRRSPNWMLLLFGMSLSTCIIPKGRSITLQNYCGRADACTGLLLSLDLEQVLRSRGIKKDVHRSLLLRALLSPFAFLSIRLGLAPAKVYVAQR